MVQSRGVVIMKSTVHDFVAIDTAPVIVNEITLVGSRCGRFAPAIKLLKAGRVRLAPLISEILPLHKAPQAFRRAATPGALKIMLQANATGA